MGRRVGVVVDQRTVQLTGQQSVDQLWGLSLVQLDAHSGAYLEGRHGSGQDVGSGSRERSDPQGRDAVPSQRFGLSFGRRQPIEHRLSMPEEELAEIRQRGTARGSGDQADAQVRLQRRQVVGHGGLAVMQGSSGPGHRAGTRNRLQNGQLAQFEHEDSLHTDYGAAPDSYPLLLPTSGDESCGVTPHDALAAHLPGLDQTCTPYADALTAYADSDIMRLDVPGHQASAHAQPGLAEFLGQRVLELDIPPLTQGIDFGDAPTPLGQAAYLAAQAWGGKRTWFLTNGASKGNLVACLALRGLGTQVVLQRSIHSSVVDGLALAGMDAAFVYPSVDAELGIANGITPTSLDETLTANPDAVAAYVVTPSYFGAVADVASLAEVAHRHGVPLVVDEAWGSHFGFHPRLPVNALRLGADLVISSTHKLAGSLTQSAMLHLGHGDFADRLEPLLDRAFRSMQSTSASALLMASLDHARHQLAVNGHTTIGASLDAVDKLRGRIVAEGRFGILDDRLLSFEDVLEVDPLRVVIDTRAGGISGHEARHLLFEEHRIHCEMSTDSVIVAVVGAGAIPDVDRLLDALHALPELGGAAADVIQLPAPGARATSVRDAYFGATEVVSGDEAIGRVSADTVAAYPPGIPNLLPGEIVTAEVVNFLQQTAAAPFGHVRGALVKDMSLFRVVTR